MLKSTGLARGFTLIELMIVVLIIAILIAVGLPNLTEFVAEQRARAAASDVVSEIMFARASAVETSRRVIMEKLGTDWNQGWRTYVDNNNNGAYDAASDTQIKQFNGFGTGVTANPNGRIYACSPTADFASQIIFRPDGRVVRGAAAPAATDGVYIVDPMGDGDTNTCNNKVYAIFFDLSGRVASRKQQSANPACKGVPLPC